MESKSNVIITTLKLRQNNVTKMTLESRQEVTLDLRQETT